MTVTGSMLKDQRLVSLLSGFFEDLIRVAATGATGRLWEEGQEGGNIMLAHFMAKKQSKHLRLPLKRRRTSLLSVMVDDKIMFINCAYSKKRNNI